MNFKTFMQKLDGKQNETIDSATEASGTLDVQSIMRIARGYGYSLDDMEERSDFPNGINLAFEGGQRGISCDQMGLYCLYPSYPVNELYMLNTTGRLYAQQSNGDTPSSVQEGVSVVPEPPYERSEGYVADRDPYTIPPNPCAELFSEPTVGSATTNTLSGPEPTYDVYSRAADRRRAETRGIREALGRQEGGVSSVCDEWESIERSAENSRESIRRSMERESGG